MQIRFHPLHLIIVFVCFTACPCAYTHGQIQSRDKSSETTVVADLKATDSEVQSVPALAERIKKSLVTVRAIGRDGDEAGLGTGFIISEDGLVATARHTIAEGHDIRVESTDGSSLPVTHVHARLDAVDLVVLKVDAEDLAALPLGDSDTVKVGQSVVAVGHPLRLRNSVVSGIVSGEQEINGVSMLQLAMTVERGSSGEPVVDRRGNVIAIVTLKSSAETNLGFAVPVRHLQRILEDPSPIPMNRWKTIGQLDPDRWQVLWDANWRQRATQILVDGFGKSFGGRSLCLQSQDGPKIPFEVQVEVKLNDESGAAGIAFHADGDDKHYGFYPSNGNIRLTRFNGPELGSWTILHNEPHSSYRLSDWNTFKVRVEKDHFKCYLNDQQVLKSVDDVLPPGRIGLATFRGTSAAFRRFQYGDSIPSQLPGAEQAAAIGKIIAEIRASRPATQHVVARMKPYAQYSTRFLEDRAKQLELRAKRMRQLASDVHAARIRSQIVQALQIRPLDFENESNKNTGNSPADLLRAALLVATLDNEDVDPDVYIARVDTIAAQIQATFPDDADEAARLGAMDMFLFQELGLRGSRYEYYTRSNSYLNEVIDDREGLPIAVSVLYIEIAKRLGLKVVGLGLPGHFVTRFEPSTDDTKPQIVDVFNKGERMSREAVEQLIKSREFPILPEFFEAQTPRQIVKRMVVNLLSLAEKQREDDRVLKYLELLVAIDESDVQYRGQRMEIRARTGRLEEAIEDLDWFIDQPANNRTKDRLFELRAELNRQLELQKQAEK